MTTMRSVKQRTRTLSNLQTYSLTANADGRSRQGSVSASPNMATADTRSRHGSTSVTQNRPYPSSPSVTSTDPSLTSNPVLSSHPIQVRKNTSSFNKQPVNVDADNDDNDDDNGGMYIDDSNLEAMQRLQRHLSIEAENEIARNDRNSNYYPSVKRNTSNSNASDRGQTANTLTDDFQISYSDRSRSSSLAMSHHDTTAAATGTAGTTDVRSEFSISDNSSPLPSTTTAASSSSLSLVTETDDNNKTDATNKRLSTIRESVSEYVI